MKRSRSLETASYQLEINAVWHALDRRIEGVMQGELSAVILVGTGHCIMGVHAITVGVDHLVDDICRDEKE